MATDDLREDELQPLAATPLPTSAEAPMAPVEEQAKEAKKEEARTEFPTWNEVVAEEGFSDLSKEAKLSVLDDWTSSAMNHYGEESKEPLKKVYSGLKYNLSTGKKLDEDILSQLKLKEDDLPEEYLSLGQGGKSKIAERLLTQRYKDIGQWNSLTDQLTTGVRKGLTKSKDGKWETPMLTEDAASVEGVPGKFIAATSGIVNSAVNKLFGESTTDLDESLKIDQQAHGLSDEDMKAGWMNMNNRVRKWGDDEILRVQSDGSVLFNETGAKGLDKNALKSAIESNSSIPDDKKAEAFTRLEATRSEIAKNKYLQYQTAVNAFNGKIGSGETDPLGIIKNVGNPAFYARSITQGLGMENRIPSPNEWGKQQGLEKEIGTANFMDRYQKEVIDKLSETQKTQFGMEANAMAGVLKLTNTVQGVAGMAWDSADKLFTGDDKPSELSEAAATLSKYSQQVVSGAPDIGMMGSVIQEVPSLAAMFATSGGAGALMRTAGVSSTRQAATMAVLQPTLAAIQSTGMTYTDAIAQGKSVGEAREESLIAGMNTGLITAAFGAGRAGGGVESAAAQFGLHEAKDMTLGQVISSIGTKELAKNMGKYALDLGKAYVGEYSEEALDELVSSFMNADPNSSLADAWVNAHKAGKVGGALGSGTHFATNLAQPSQAQSLQSQSLPEPRQVQELKTAVQGGMELGLNETAKAAAGNIPLVNAEAQVERAEVAGEIQAGLAEAKAQSKMDYDALLEAADQQERARVEAEKDKPVNVSGVEVPQGELGLKILGAPPSGRVYPDFDEDSFVLGKATKDNLRPVWYNGQETSRVYNMKTGEFQDNPSKTDFMTQPRAIAVQPKKAETEYAPEVEAVLNPTEAAQPKVAEKAKAKPAPVKEAAPEAIGYPETPDTVTGAPAATPGITPDTTPSVAPSATPDATPGVTPVEAPPAELKQEDTAKAAAVASPEVSPKVAPEEQVKQFVKNSKDVDHAELVVAAPESLYDAAAETAPNAESDSIGREILKMAMNGDEAALEFVRGEGAEVIAPFIKAAEESGSPVIKEAVSKLTQKREPLTNPAQKVDVPKETEQAFDPKAPVVKVDKTKVPLVMESRGKRLRMPFDKLGFTPRVGQVVQVMDVDGNVENAYVVEKVTGVDALVKPQAESQAKFKHAPEVLNSVAEALKATFGTSSPIVGENAVKAASSFIKSIYSRMAPGAPVVESTSVAAPSWVDFVDGKPVVYINPQFIADELSKFTGQLPLTFNNEAGWKLLSDQVANYYTVVADHELRHVATANAIPREEMIQLYFDVAREGGAKGLEAITRGFNSVLRNRTTYGMDLTNEELTTEQVKDLMEGKPIEVKGEKVELTQEQLSSLIERAMMEEVAFIASEVASGMNPDFAYKGVMDALADLASTGKMNQALRRFSDMIARAAQAIRNLINGYSTLKALPDSMRSTISRINAEYNKNGYQTADIYNARIEAHRQAAEQSKAMASEMFRSRRDEVRESQRALNNAMIRVRNRLGTKVAPVVLGKNGELVVNTALPLTDSEKGMIEKELPTLNSQVRAEQALQMKQANADLAALSEVPQATWVAEPANAYRQAMNGILAKLNPLVQKAVRINLSAQEAATFDELNNPVSAVPQEVEVTDPDGTVRTVKQKTPYTRPEDVKVTIGSKVVNVRSASAWLNAYDNSPGETAEFFKNDPKTLHALEEASVERKAAQRLRDLPGELEYYVMGGKRPPSLYKPSDTWENVNAKITHGLRAMPMAAANFLFRPGTRQERVVQFLKSALMSGRTQPLITEGADVEVDVSPFNDIKPDARMNPRTGEVILDSDLEKKMYSQWGLQQFAKTVKQAVEDAFAILGVDFGNKVDEFENYELTDAAKRNARSFIPAMIGRLKEAHAKSQAPEQAKYTGGFSFPVEMNKEGYTSYPEHIIELPEIAEFTAKGVWDNKNLGGILKAAAKFVMDHAPHQKNGYTNPLLDTAQGITPAGFAYNLVAPLLTEIVAVTKGTNTAPERTLTAVAPELYDQMLPGLSNTTGVFKELRDQLDGSVQSRAQAEQELTKKIWALRRMLQVADNVYNETMSQLRNKKLNTGNFESALPFSVKAMDSIVFNLGLRRVNSSPVDGTAFVSMMMPVRAQEMINGLNEAKRELQGYVRSVAPGRVIRDAEGNITGREAVEGNYRQASDNASDKGIDSERDSWMIPILEWSGERNEEYFQKKLQVWRSMIAMSLNLGDYGATLEFFNGDNFSINENGDHLYNHDAIDDHLFTKLEELRDDEVKMGVVKTEDGMESYDAALTGLAESFPDHKETIDLLKTHGGQVLSQLNSGERFNPEPERRYAATEVGIAMTLASNTPGIQFVMGKAGWESRVGAAESGKPIPTISFVPDPTKPTVLIPFGTQDIDPREAQAAITSMVGWILANSADSKPIHAQAKVILDRINSLNKPLHMAAKSLDKLTQIALARGQGVLEEVQKDKLVEYSTRLADSLTSQAKRIYGRMADETKALFWADSFRMTDAQAAKIIAGAFTNPHVKQLLTLGSIDTNTQNEFDDITRMQTGQLISSANASAMLESALTDKVLNMEPGISEQDSEELGEWARESNEEDVGEVLEERPEGEVLPFKDGSVESADALLHNILNNLIARPVAGMISEEIPQQLTKYEAMQLLAVYGKPSEAQKFLMSLETPVEDANLDEDNIPMTMDQVVEEATEDQVRQFRERFTKRIFASRDDTMASDRARAYGPFSFTDLVQPKTTTSVFHNQRVKTGEVEFASMLVENEVEQVTLGNGMLKTISRLDVDDLDGIAARMEAIGADVYIQYDDGTGPKMMNIMELAKQQQNEQDKRVIADRKELTIQAESKRQALKTLQEQKEVLDRIDSQLTENATVGDVKKAFGALEPNDAAAIMEQAGDITRMVQDGRNLSLATAMCIVDGAADIVKGIVGVTLEQLVSRSGIDQLVEEGGRLQRAITTPTGEQRLSALAHDIDSIAQEITNLNDAGLETDEDYAQLAELTEGLDHKITLYNTRVASAGHRVNEKFPGLMNPQLFTLPVKEAFMLDFADGKTKQKTDRFAGFVSNLSHPNGLIKITSDSASRRQLAELRKGVSDPDLQAISGTPGFSLRLSKEANDEIVSILSSETPRDQQIEMIHKIVGKEVITPARAAVNTIKAKLQQNLEKAHKEATSAGVVNAEALRKMALVSAKEAGLSGIRAARIAVDSIRKGLNAGAEMTIEELTKINKAITKLEAEAAKRAAKLTTGSHLEIREVNLVGSDYNVAVARRAFAYYANAWAHTAKELQQQGNTDNNAITGFGASMTAAKETTEKMVGKTREEHMAIRQMERATGVPYQVNDGIAMPVGAEEQVAQELSQLNLPYSPEDVKAHIANTTSAGILSNPAQNVSKQFTPEVNDATDKVMEHVMDSLGMFKDASLKSDVPSGRPLTKDEKLFNEAGKKVHAEFKGHSQAHANRQELRHIISSILKYEDSPMMDTFDAFHSMKEAEIQESTMVPSDRIRQVASILRSGKPTPQDIRNLKALFNEINSYEMAMKMLDSYQKGFVGLGSFMPEKLANLTMHQQAIVRSAFSGSAEATQNTENAMALLNGGASSHLGLNGAASRKQTIAKVLKESAEKVHGEDRLEKISLAYGVEAAIAHITSGTNKSAQEKAEILLTSYAQGLAGLGSVLGKMGMPKGWLQWTGAQIQRFSDYWGANTWKLVNQRYMTAEVIGKIRPILEEVAAGANVVDASEKLRGLLDNSKKPDDKSVREYAATLRAMFTMAREDYRQSLNMQGIDTAFVDKLPLIPLSWKSFEKNRLVNKDFNPTTNDQLNMLRTAWTKNPTRTMNDKYTNLLDLHGFEAPHRVLSDMYFKMNVAPAYDTVRAIVGRSESRGPVKGSESTVMTEEDEGSLGLLMKDRENPRALDALKTVSGLIQTAVDNEMNVGVNNRFIDLQKKFQTLGVTKALNSLGNFFAQQVGLLLYSTVREGGSKAVRDKDGNLLQSSRFGNTDFWSIAAKYASSKAFRTQVQSITKQLSPTALRGAEGNPDLVELTQDLKPAFRNTPMPKFLGSGSEGSRKAYGMAKAGATIAPRAIRKASLKMVEWQIAKPESMGVRLVFVHNLWKQSNEKLVAQGIPAQTIEEFLGNYEASIDYASVHRATTLAEDIYAITEVAKKAKLLQPSDNTLIEIARQFFTMFANHPLSLSANSMAALRMAHSPDKKVREEGVRILATNIGQNVAFQLAKYHYAVKLLSHAFAAALGWDDEKRKAWQLKAHGINPDSKDPLSVMKSPLYWTTALAGRASAPFGFDMNKMEFSEDKANADLHRLSTNIGHEMVTNMMPGAGPAFATTLGGALDKMAIGKLMSAFFGKPFEGERAGLVLPSSDDKVGPEGNAGEALAYEGTQFLVDDAADRTFALAGLAALLDPFVKASNAPEDLTPEQKTLLVASAIPALPREARQILDRWFVKSSGAKTWDQSWNKDDRKSKSATPKRKWKRI